MMETYNAGLNFELKVLSHKFTKLYNIHPIGTFSNTKSVPGWTLLCKLDLLVYFFTKDFRLSLCFWFDCSHYVVILVKAT